MSRYQNKIPSLVKQIATPQGKKKEMPIHARGYILSLQIT
jgi:hypothetical protein